MSGIWKMLILVLLGWAVMAMVVNQSQANSIRDLQRRVGQLEATTEVRE